MKKRLDQLTIENFRIFKDPVSFKFSDITVFTGANNSGKSTVIKAIKLFMEGVERSDFPMINLLKKECDLGTFKNILNHNSEKKYFSLGFPTRIAKIPADFSLQYTFTNGIEARDHFRDTAIFANLELIDCSGKVFFGIYSEDALGSMASIDLPSDSGDPGLLQIRINLDLLTKYLPIITNSRFSKLLSHMKKIMGPDNCWWGECFHEGQYSLVNYDISKFSFADLETELDDDFYFNLARYNYKKSLFFDSNSDEERYQELRKDTRYSEFIKLVIHPILQSIKYGLNLFKNNNILHILPENTQDRIILNYPDTEYIQRLSRIMDESRNIKFIREGLSRFNIDGLIEIVPHLTSAFEINLITNVALTLQEKKEEIINKSKEYRDDSDDFTSDFLKKFNLDPSLYEEHLSLYDGNQRINISDLGKGVSNIIKLILKISSILFNIEDDVNKKVTLQERQGRRPISVIKKTILIEEPEAFLHPNWQSCLADFFSFCHKKYDVQFVIETHSEYLIRKLQYLTAKSVIDQKDSIVYYFNDPKSLTIGEEQVKTIQILSDGSLTSDFGPGFFDEAINLKLDILKLKNTQKN